jgi:hypothetical protein
MTLSRAQQRRERRELIQKRYEKAIRRGVASPTSNLEGRKGPWGYRLTADQDIDERGCPLCFRNYSDYEVTALAPCWRCRDEVSLANCGPLGQDSALIEDPLTVFSVESLDRFELEMDVQVIKWRNTRKELQTAKDNPRDASAAYRLEMSYRAQP